jgi:Domain of unknown function (DUF4291)
MTSATPNEIRADYDRQTIVVYQAYRPQIAEAALAAGKFVPPFSFGRMTWIKPSFLWLMERSNWAQKSGQECVLAVRITRAGWEQALSSGVLTQHDPKVYRGYDDWKQQFDAAAVHIQWDPERSLRGATLAYNAIQVGISRHVIQTYVEEWITRIEDYTPLVRKIYKLVQSGNERKAKDLLPRERVYPVAEALARKIGMT